MNKVTITIEGPRGSGKTVLAQLIEEVITLANLPVVPAVDPRVQKPRTPTELLRALAGMRELKTMVTLVERNS